MNILTFDIEEWAVAKANGYGSVEKYAEYDGCLGKILDVMDARNFKGTFFCTGMMATDFPQVVKLIRSRGHEIGCHSFKHVWLNTMSKEELKEDTHKSVVALEQCIGQKIKSYRAPAFSIGKENRWAFEILAQQGITRDASVYPAERDLGGFAQFGEKTPTMVYCNNAMFKEFPVSTTRLLGHELAYTGGGYFRFFPLSYVKKEMAKADYVMTYFHIGDLIPESSGMMSRKDFENYYKIKGTLKNRLLRHVKTNIGRKSAFVKLIKLMETEDFVNLEQADKIIDWEQAPSVII